MCTDTTHCIPYPQSADDYIVKMTLYPLPKSNKPFAFSLELNYYLFSQLGTEPEFRGKEEENCIFDFCLPDASVGMH